MASFKQSSLVGLIFCLILVSSFVNAARTIDGVLPQADDGECHYLGSCTDKADCTSQCDKQPKYYPAGICIPDPVPRGSGVPQGLRCCCLIA
ncbi:hypothetical protein MKW94_012144 [Papaver nudicaule]|uniref:Uncharacterized protein n=1 Tax=Papaver nudicaule TaxID=74823 RepID=A0AA41V7Z8_PAPNU|nr:hypothetical protein [Papaver nudicaule]